MDTSLDRLVAIAESQDGFSSGHSERVMNLSWAIGMELGLSAADLQALRLGALLHDVGKVGIPTRILAKHGNLSAGDREWVRKHPKIGHELLRYRRDLRKSLPVVLHHHERMDGSGYPHGLCGREIPLVARITAVADVFDAMASPRPYRGALPGSTVVRYLLREVSLGRLDGEIVRILADSIREGKTPAPAVAVAA